MKIVAIYLFIVLNLYAGLTYENMCNKLIKNEEYSKLKYIKEYCYKAIDEARDNNQKMYLYIESGHFKQMFDFIRNKKIYPSDYDKVAYAYLLEEDYEHFEKYFMDYIEYMSKGIFTSKRKNEFFYFVKKLMYLYPSKKETIQRLSSKLYNEVLSQKEPDDKKCLDQLYQKKDKMDYNKIFILCNSVKNTNDNIIKLVQDKFKEEKLCNYYYSHAKNKIGEITDFEMACSILFFINKESEKTENLFKRFSKRVDSERYIQNQTKLLKNILKYKRNI